MSSTWKAGFMILALLALGAAVHAAEPVKADAEVKITATPNGHEGVYASSTTGPYYYQNEYELRFHKLARGIGNVVLCPAEIPNQMFREAYMSSPINGAFVGAFKGLWKGTKRLCIGTWEIVTFYHPGSNHYQPYIEPEVVFMEYVH